MHWQFEMTYFVINGPDAIHSVLEDVGNPLNLVPDSAILHIKTSE